MTKLKWVELESYHITTAWVLIDSDTTEILDELTEVYQGRWRWLDEAVPVEFLDVEKAKKYIKEYRKRTLGDD